MKEKVRPTTTDAPEFIREWTGWGLNSEEKIVMVINR
jgi:hypothetical protein